MEGRLVYAMRQLGKEGNPETARERLLQLVGAHSMQGICTAEYMQARSEGLSISEAELAIAIQDGLRSVGIEGFLSKLEKPGSPKHSLKLKRKRRKPKEEKELKKKAKSLL